MLDYKVVLLCFTERCLRWFLRQGISSPSCPPSLAALPSPEDSTGTYLDYPNAAAQKTSATAQCKNTEQQWRSGWACD